MARIYSCQPIRYQSRLSNYVSDYVMHQQNKLLGHVIRADRQDPMRMQTINSKLNTPGVVLRRSGKPRLPWVRENCEWVYQEVLEKNWHAEQEEQCIQEIVKAAIDRQC